MYIAEITQQIIFSNQFSRGYYKDNYKLEDIRKTTMDFDVKNENN